jgi:hypothetical protein
MVLMEKALITTKKGKNDAEPIFSSNQIMNAIAITSQLVLKKSSTISSKLRSQITSLKPRTHDIQLYNMEPFSGPATYVDMGIELYDMEADL